jgi:L-threonylcarbamoyladenylate synthase
MIKAQTLQLSEIDGEKLQQIGTQIKDGVIAVLPTDTIYGIVGTALNSKTVEKIYRLRKRTSSKPMILLVESEKQIIDLGINLSLKQTQLLFKVWPNPISVVIDAPLQKLQYLHRGKKSLAFRVPNNEWLLKLLKITGPIVAPSANFEGEDPAKNILEARKYFNDSVELYIDAGELKSKPSTLVKLEQDKLTVLREGLIKIPAEFLK